MALVTRASVLVLALLAILPAAEPVAVTAESQLAPPVEVPAGVIVATLSQNGRVRYGPSKQANVVVTLKQGQTVEVIGRSKVPEWWIVRMPKEAKAYMHNKVLAAVDGGKRWRITEDKARARNDARVTAEIVAELDKGSIVEDRENPVGDWRAVYLPEAIAYMHESVLTMPANVQEAMAAAAQKGEAAKLAWANAQQVYASFKATLDQDRSKALELDWKGLGASLDQVIASHPDAEIKVAAQRLKEPVGAVIAAVDAVRTGKGLTPAPEPTKPVEPVNVEAGIKPVPTVKPAPELVTTAQIKQLGDAATAAAMATQEKKAWPYQGFVSQKDFPKVGVSDVILDDDGNVVAFLKVKAGANVNLSEYYWRWVGLKGTATVVDKANHDFNRDIPLVEVEDLKIVPH